MVARMTGGGERMRKTVKETKKIDSKTLFKTVS